MDPLLVGAGILLWILALVLRLRSRINDGGPSTAAATRAASPSSSSDRAGAGTPAPLSPRAIRCAAIAFFFVGALFIHVFVTSKSAGRWVPEHYVWRWTPSVAATREYEKREGMTPVEAAAARAKAAFADTAGQRKPVAAAPPPTAPPPPGRTRTRRPTTSPTDWDRDRDDEEVGSPVDTTPPPTTPPPTPPPPTTPTTPPSTSRPTQDDRKIARLNKSCPIVPRIAAARSQRRSSCKHVDLKPEWVARVNVSVVSSYPPPVESPLWKRNRGKPLDLRSAERFWTRSKDGRDGRVSSVMGRGRASVARSLKRARARRTALNGKLPPFQPNLYIFVLDSVDRHTLHSNAPNFIRELRAKAAAAGARVYEYVRYSTIGWGTSPNTGALFRGCARIPGSKNTALDCTNGHPTLSAAYGAHGGYAMMGGEHSYDAKRAPSSHKKATERKDGKGNLYDGVFSQHVVQRGCRAGRRGIDLHVELFVRLHEEFEAQDPARAVPRYFAFHDSEQHGGDGTCDACLRPLVGPIDFANSIVFVTADHGAGHGKTTSGIAQRANPAALLSVPGNFGGAGGGADASRLHAMLASNQERFVTHWDMHETLLAWAGGGAAAGGGRPPVGASSYCAGGGCKWLQANLPTEKHVPWPFAVRLDRAVAPADRTCKDARSVSNFCFCDLASTYEEPAAKLAKYAKFVKPVVDAVNRYTGNGRYACAKLSAGDFRVTKLVRGAYDRAPMFATIGRRDGRAAPSYTANMLKGAVLRSSNQYKQRDMPEISRNDRFDAEPCLGDTGEDRHPPLFKDAQPGVQLLRGGKYSDQWNLRWCSCKK